MCELPMAKGNTMTKVNNLPMHELVVFDKSNKKVLSEISISAVSISKAVKKVKQNFEDSNVLVLQKSAMPNLGIFSFESTARLNVG